MTKKITVTELKKIIRGVVKEAFDEKEMASRYAELGEDEVDPIIADHFASLRPVSMKEFTSSPKYREQYAALQGWRTTFEDALIGVGPYPHPVSSRGWYTDPETGAIVKVDALPGTVLQFWDATNGHNDPTIHVWHPGEKVWVYVEL